MGCLGMGLAQGSACRRERVAEPVEGSYHGSDPAQPLSPGPGERMGRTLAVTSKGAGSTDGMGAELQQMLLVLDSRRMWRAGAGSTKRGPQTSKAPWVQLIPREKPTTGHDSSGDRP